jgi:hypothetical protein
MRLAGPPAAHRVTSAHLQAAYPFVAEGGLPCSRIYIGRDLFGSSFVFDPWQLYQQRIITGLNMLVLGMIGRGKSALVKSLLLRSVLHGNKGGFLTSKANHRPRKGPRLCAAATRPRRDGPPQPARPAFFVAGPGRTRGSAGCDRPQPTAATRGANCP